MKIDARVLRIWMAGVVFGAGASYLFSGSDRAQYVFFVSLVGWLLLFIISRLRR